MLCIRCRHVVGGTMLDLSAVEHMPDVGSVRAEQQTVLALGRVTMPPPNTPAAIPFRSPFRYPGGKTWLIPTARRWLHYLRAMPRPPLQLLEPFAGGASVSLDAVCEGLVTRAKLVELDTAVASVWQTILSKDGAWLARAILNFRLTDDTLREQLERHPRSTREHAFQTILRNRVNHGGILARQAGRIRHGDTRRGVGSRWYPQSLAARILTTAALH